MKRVVRPWVEDGPFLTVTEAAKLQGPIVYALCDGDEVAFYVGQTKRAHGRFYAHRENRTKNERMRQKIIDCKGQFTVIVLERPALADLSRLELHHINRRPWTLNLVRKEHFGWQFQQELPWVAGPGVHCPSTLSLYKMKNPEHKRVSRAYLAALTHPQRCALEIELYREFPYFVQKRLNRWLDTVQDKMLVCLERSFQ